MNTYIVTFAIGGPLRNQFAKFTASTELDVRRYCIKHFPRDWAFIYSPEGFEGQADKFGLRLCFEEVLPVEVEMEQEITGGRL